LEAGTRMPPSRELADRLGISRDTVVRAYEELKRLAFIESDSTRGYRVSTIKVSDSNETSPETYNARLSMYGRRILSRLDSSPLISEFAQLNYGGPPLELLPVKRWRNCLKSAADSIGGSHHHPELMGKPELRKEIAAYLHRNKQISARGENVVIFTSTISATNLLCRILMNPGDCLAIEDPGFGGIKDIAALQNLEIFSVPIDEEGLIVDELRRAPEPVKLVYITPGRQEPTGAVLSLERRKALLNWARENDAWILEDDFDGFFDYGKSKLPAVAGIATMNRNDRVIYLSTFWRLLYPLTGLGFCLLPHSLRSVVEQGKMEVEAVAESATQIALTMLLEDGYLEKYTRRLKAHYLDRRNRCIESIRALFGQDMELKGGGTGTQLNLKSTRYTEEEIFAAANKSGLPLISTSGYYLSEKPDGSFNLDFSIMSEAEIIQKSREFFKSLNS
ncbi:MAG TPA: PLP-dependent aminotransferase family protein, partial [Candidatus Melainabacteria bacterium]|nr:PLP-dependent aminotransferase family protein [Candidatus Melainabacteria bacterium]